MLLKINRPQIGLFFAQNSIARHFESPLPIIFNWKFHFGKVKNFNQILLEFSPRAGFGAFRFESPRVANFSPEIPFQKTLKFYTDFMQIFVVCP